MRRIGIAILWLTAGCFAGKQADGREPPEATTGVSSATTPAETMGVTGDPPPGSSTSSSTAGTDSSSEGDDSSSESTGAGDESSTGGDGVDVLLDMPGVVFTPSAAEPVRVINGVGAPGAAYSFVRVELDVDIATFRTDLPPDGIPRWDHILLGVSRDNQPQSYQRYLFGASARVEDANASRAFNYSRVEIAEGSASYTAFRTNYPWQENTSIHLDQWIDATTSEQTLEVSVDGVVELTSTGPVEYFVPALTTDGLFLELGTEDADWGLHVSPWDWTFSNLRVTALPE